MVIQRCQPYHLKIRNRGKNNSSSQVYHLVSASDHTVKTGGVSASYLPTSHVCEYTQFAGMGPEPL